jgi:hypothetical protein
LIEYTPSILRNHVFFLVFLQLLFLYINQYASSHTQFQHNSTQQLNQFHPSFQGFHWLNLCYQEVHEFFFKFLYHLLLFLLFIPILTQFITIKVIKFISLFVWAEVHPLKGKTCFLSNFPQFSLDPTLILVQNHNFKLKISFQTTQHIILNFP